MMNTIDWILVAHIVLILLQAFTAIVQYLIGQAMKVMIQQLNKLL